MKNKTVLSVILFISIFALIAAYFVEYILDYKPCNLCLIERLPYFFAIVIIFLYLTINRFEKLIFIFLGLIFASGTILSFYHFGIEQGFFKESLVCISNDEINSLDKENLMKELQKIKPPSPIKADVVPSKIPGIVFGKRHHPLPRDLISLHFLNELLKKLATENGYTYLDYYTTMVNEEKGMMQAYTTDGVHCTLKGYQVMEGLVSEVLERLLQ